MNKRSLVMNFQLVTLAWIRSIWDLHAMYDVIHRRTSIVRPPSQKERVDFLKEIGDNLSEITVEVFCNFYFFFRGKQCERIHHTSCRENNLVFWMIFWLPLSILDFYLSVWQWQLNGWPLNMGVTVHPVSTFFLKYWYMYFMTPAYCLL